VSSTLVGGTTAGTGTVTLVATAMQSPHDFPGAWTVTITFESAGSGFGSGASIVLTLTPYSTVVASRFDALGGFSRNTVLYSTWYDVRSTNLGWYLNRGPVFNTPNNLGTTALNLYILERRNFANSSTVTIATTGLGTAYAFVVQDSDRYSGAVIRASAHSFRLSVVSAVNTTTGATVTAANLPAGYRFLPVQLHNEHVARGGTALLRRLQAVAVQRRPL
jgi:hypothetical protein